jgi:3-hydroxyacyl-CoA dehydrogenase
MNNFMIRKVAVLGAGVMGAQIAAHCINARVPVLLFDLPDEKSADRNGIVRRSVDGLRKLSPAPLANADEAQYLEAANYGEDLARLAQCDLVIEAIAERMDWKLDLYRKVAPHVAPHAIFASNTSGLAIRRLAQELPADLKPRFCGVHFFNPPRYMHLVELIPTADTQPGILDSLEAFLTTSLGKGVVRASDTPNFIANRVGVFGMLATIHEAQLAGLPFDVVDDLTGSRLGRAKSATFRTADVVGLDTMAHVIQTMKDNLPASADPFAAHYELPAVLAGLVAKGALGQKSKAGFYRKQGRVIQVLDPSRGDYVDSGGKADELVKRILKKPAAERLALLRSTDHPQAKFLWAIFRDAFHYCAVHLESIAETARDVDFALRWGFGWDTGPFETWQQAGWTQVAQWVREDIEAGRALSKAPLPSWVFEGPVAKAGAVHTAQGSWSPRQRKFVPRAQTPVYARQLFRAQLAGDGLPDPKSAGTSVHEDDAVRIWTAGEGLAAEVLVLSLKTKMHALSPAVVAGVARAVGIAEERYRGLVIWSPDDPFSAGADLQALLPLFMSGGVKAIGEAEKQMQDAFLRVKYSQVPVVAAVSGMALGGGCEILLHCARRVASLESYIGLVEVGIGLLPGAGGLKEGALRAARAAAALGQSDPLPWLKTWFQNAAMARVATSAFEAKSMGYLQGEDVVVMNRHELLWCAIGQAFSMHALGYRPPLPARPIPAAGRAVAATIRSQLVNMRDGGFISAHDYHIADQIADVLCGGDVDAGTPIDETWLLALERKNFLGLLAHPKSQERMMGFLQNGKPVRN